MKKKIIFVHFNKFLGDFDWERYELDILSQQFNVEVHELLQLTHPNLTLKYNEENNKNYIKRFKNFKSWKNYFKDIYNSSTLVIFQSMPYTFNSLRCYLFIKKLKIICSVISINNLPSFKDYDSKISLKEDFYLKLKSFFFRPKQAFLTIQNILILNIIKFFNKNFSPDFALVGGNNYFSNMFKKNYFFYSKIIKINSWDYSSSLRQKKVYSDIKKYILYISDGEARFPSDSSLVGSKRVEDPSNYCKNLCIFFDKIESYFNLKVIIASHPRASIEGNIDPKLGKRNCFKGITEELVKKSDFVINLGSTAASYAVMHSKPILFIYSSEDQLKNIPGMKKVKFISTMLNAQRIDINNFDKFEDLRLDFNKDAYNKYFTKYICVQNNLPNHKIITDEIMKYI